MKHLIPTPEYLQALGRAEEKYGAQHAVEHVTEEIAAMRRTGDSICKGLAEEQAHRAVAARYPHLYTS
jgi:hypothetical protein